MGKLEKVGNAYQPFYVHGNSTQPFICSLSFHYHAIKNGISKKWDPTPETFGGTRHPRPGTHHMGETQDTIPGTLKVRPETQDPSPIS